jgi:hypothetical protein
MRLVLFCKGVEAEASLVIGSLIEEVRNLE